MVPLAVFGDGKVYLPIHKAEPQYHGQHRRREPCRQLPAVMQQQPEQPHAQHADQQNAPVAQRFLHHANGGGVVFFIGHPRKGNAAQGTQRHKAQRAAVLGFAQVGFLQRHSRGGAEHQNRHIIPARIIAGIEGIEHAVQHRHKGADKAHFHDARKGVAPPHAAEHQPARNAHHRQVDGHAGVL